LNEEEESNTSGTPSEIHELETGIFNLVITLTQLLSQNNNHKQARAYVIRYLERLSAGLRLADEQQGEQQDD